MEICMELENLKKEYEKMQQIYGDKALKSINFGGCTENPDICFVFMNPTSKNIASNPLWNGIRAPWIGTKNIWDLFVATNLFDINIYNEIKSKKANEWNKEFADKVYDEVKKNKLFITNLGKCTQVDARPIQNSVYEKYLSLLEREIEIVDPKVIVLFGNQVSTVFLKEKISVSQCRKIEFIKNINGKEYKCYAIFYPIGNGRFNINKSIEDILWIKENVLNKEVIKC
jgi:uracil DNA glycosylase superfamily